ncbi:MAG: PDZ domain-containing protein, partial [Alloprevotella sp.]|nr:PDZ domain-containing protein [Alloprevotella sp.]
MKSSFLTFLLMLVSFGSVTAQSRHNAETAKQLDIFNSLYRELDLYYVDTLNATKNIGNAILYMLDQVDPYTEYYSESHTDDLKQMTTGKYAGIGAVISARKDIGRCIISHPYEGMPAAVAGLRAGDVILSVNGVDMGEIGQRELSEYSSAVSAALRGDAGTICELRVRRPG